MCRRTDVHQYILWRHTKLAELLNKRWIRHKAGEINIFFGAFVAFHFSARSTEASQRTFRKGARYDHARGQAKSKMICRLMLVIHQRNGFHSEPARGCDLRARAMADRDIKP